VDTGGVFILKPQSDPYPELPENEDLTMQIAAIPGLEIPPHGMIYAKDGSFIYFLRRFDCVGRKGKPAMEDCGRKAATDLIGEETLALKHLGSNEPEG
jgi:serine/threonine-protein kinase HipA